MTGVQPRPTPGARQVALLAEFSIDDLEIFSEALRTIGDGAHGIEGAAARVTAYLDERLAGLDGDRACVNLSLHMTHPFAGLPPERQAQAASLDPSVTASTACLTPLSIAGHVDEAEPGGVALPLTDPMFSTRPILLTSLQAMGLNRELATERTEVVLSGVHRKELEAFLVPDLRVSDLLGPDERERVQALGIRSLLGIGGGLPTGDLFVLFLFARDVVTDRSAYLLRALAPAIKATLIPHALHPWP